MISCILGSISLALLQAISETSRTSSLHFGRDFIEASHLSKRHFFRVIKIWGSPDLNFVKIVTVLIMNHQEYFLIKASRTSSSDFGRNLITYWSVIFVGLSKIGDLYTKILENLWLLTASIIKTTSLGSLPVISGPSSTRIILFWKSYFCPIIKIWRPPNKKF